MKSKGKKKNNFWINVLWSVLLFSIFCLFVFIQFLFLFEVSVVGVFMKIFVKCMVGIVPLDLDPLPKRITKRFWRFYILCIFIKCFHNCPPCFFVIFYYFFLVCYFFFFYFILGERWLWHGWHSFCGLWSASQRESPVGLDGFTLFT